MTQFISPLFAPLIILSLGLVLLALLIVVKYGPEQLTHLADLVRAVRGQPHDRGESSDAD